MFISGVYDAQAAVTLIELRLSQMPAHLRRGLRKLLCSGKARRHVTGNRFASAVAWPDCGVVLIAGNGRRRQKLRLSLELVTHETAHLVCPRTGGAPPRIRAAWDTAHRMDPPPPSYLQLYHDDLVQVEMWADSVAWLLCELTGEPSSLPRTLRAMGRAANRAADAYPQQARIALQFLHAA